jgi:hypothetical protein
LRDPNQIRAKKLAELYILPGEIARTSNHVG